MLAGVTVYTMCTTVVEYSSAAQHIMVQLVFPMNYSTKNCTCLETGK